MTQGEISQNTTLEYQQFLREMVPIKGWFTPSEKQASI